MINLSTRNNQTRLTVIGLAACIGALVIGTGAVSAAGLASAASTGRSGVEQAPLALIATKTAIPTKRTPVPTKTPRATVTPTPDLSIFAPDEEKTTDGFQGDWEVTDALARGVDDVDAAVKDAIGQQVRIMPSEDGEQLLMVELPYTGPTEPILWLKVTGDLTAEGEITNLGEDPIAVSAELSDDGQTMRMTSEVQAGVYILDLTKLDAGNPTADDTPIEPDELVFTDDFSNNKAKWPESKSNNATWAFKSGKYQITVLVKDISAWANPGLTLDDFIAQVEAAKTTKADAGYGFLFRYADNRNFYRFEVYSTGYYRFMASVDNEWKTLVDWEKSDAIKVGNATNVLKVASKGERFQFYVNDELVASYSDDIYTEGDVAIMAAAFDTGNVRVNFDKLRVWSVK